MRELNVAEYLKDLKAGGITRNDIVEELCITSGTITTWKRENRIPEHHYKHLQLMNRAKILDDIIYGLRYLILNKKDN